VNNQSPMNNLHQAMMVGSFQQNLVNITNTDDRNLFKNDPIEWLKVSNLTPESLNFNIILLIHSIEVVAERMTELGRIRVGEIVVGDTTGTVVISARNAQIDMMIPGETIVIKHGRIDMFDGYIRLRVDKFGTMSIYGEEEEGEEGNTSNKSSLPPKPETVNLKNNISERQHQWVE
jgi:hypothetical protein